jgi:heme exporter protein C
MLLVNLSLILGLTSLDLIKWSEPPNRIVYIVFFYHVAGAWLSYLSFGVSLVSHVLYLKYKKINWNRLGTNSIIVGIFFITFALITGSLFYNATSGNYNNIYWQWSDGRQTMTLVLFLSYLSYLIFRSMIDDKEKKAKLSSALGIALFPTVPLSYISAIIFTSLHPLINPNPDTSGGIYWDALKLYILFFNLIALTILFVWVVRQLNSLDKAREKLEELIQKRLLEG